ncbi:MAG: outer membrane beta-barrel protein [candidate division Zixibacteria bacterium]|nr:outer membrane beta-barrel protein [candidate division Zixibacteria bacterium]
MKRVVLLACLILLISSSAVFGFDGQRKGFVIGGGVGVSPGSSWKVDDTLLGVFPIKGSESRVGVAANLFLGYAWDEKNMIVYEFNGSGYESDKINHKFQQGFSGPAWYHYWGSKGSSLFTAFGLGLYALDIEDIKKFDPGPGVLFGVGYEFSRHLQIGVYLGGGKTSVGSLDVEHGHLSIVFNAVAF